MPGINGFEVCRRLKADEKTQDIPVIFMTALDSLEDKVKGFEAGGVDYVTKPIQHEELFARITTHLRIRDLTIHLNAKVE
jgi:DNA-binding response OmpR family regulator